LRVMYVGRTEETVHSTHLTLLIRRHK
jgi:hypothetical protein